MSAVSFVVFIVASLALELYLELVYQFFGFELRKKRVDIKSVGYLLHLLYIEQFFTQLERKIDVSVL